MDTDTKTPRHHFTNDVDYSFHLPKQQARCAHYFASGLTYKSIAELEGCAVGTVRSRLSRARDRIERITSEGKELTLLSGQANADA
jgi:DNA-binding NarL/FixJ family response regulator